MLLNRDKLIMLQNSTLIHGDLPVGSAICHKQRAYSQKLTPYLFQNDVALYSQSHWKRENTTDINFWGFNKLKD